MKQHIVIYCYALALIFRIVNADEAGPVSMDSMVAFNTICAMCHEGECSGRMSLTAGPMNAATHIRRYAGDRPDNGVAELYVVLSYMKTQCAYFPLPASIPTDKHWDTSMLASFSLPSRQGYFVPLGMVKDGSYEAILKANSTSGFCVEILTDDFELLDGRCANSIDSEMRLWFVVPDAASAYLRLRSEQPLNFTELKLSAQ